VIAKRVVEFSDDHTTALAAIEGIADGKGWCNLTPEVSADDVDVLSPSVFSLRTQRGAPIASYVTSPPKLGERSTGTLGVLHTRGRLGKERIAAMLDGAPFTLRQDHNQRGMLLEVPADTPATTILDVMCRVLVELCDYERTGRWRMELYERP
jgi:hypothetical protein